MMKSGVKSRHVVLCVCGKPLHGSVQVLGRKWGGSRQETVGKVQSVRRGRHQLRRQTHCFRRPVAHTYSSSSFQGLPARTGRGGRGGIKSRRQRRPPGSWQIQFTVCEGLRRWLCWSFGTSVNSPTCTRRSLILRNSMPAAPVQARPNHNSTESELCFEGILQQPG